MNALLPSSLLPSPQPVRLEFALMGQDFGPRTAPLASLSGPPDAAVDALPPEWVQLPALLWTLNEDEHLATEEAANEASVPVGLVRVCRPLTGL